MKFINTIGSSVWVDDLGIHLPFQGEKVQEIDSNSILKSHSLQSLFVVGQLEIVEAGDTRIEQNLERLHDRYLKKCEESYQEEDNTNEENDMPSGDDLEVVVKGHFYEAGGYPKTNRNLVFGLHSVGAKVEMRPVNSNKNDLNEMEIAQLNNFKKKVGKDAIIIDSIIPTFSDISPTRSYKILYTTIEACSVPDQIVEVCNRYNEVWVTSDFCKKVLVKYGVTRPVLVMGNSVNTTLYNQDYEPYDFSPPLNNFVFLSIFGWSYRKGYDALLKAYLRAFDNTDDVSLLIMSRFQYTSSRSKVIKETIDKYLDENGRSNSPHIARCSRVIPEYEMPRIYAAGDAFVLPSRGEGFGLPFLEASLCGLPVISSNHSGQTMFLNDKNSYLVDVDRISPVIPGSMHVHYWDNELFPELKSEKFIDDLADTMTEVYNDIEKAKKRNKILEKHIKDNYSIGYYINRIKSRLDEIWLELKRG